MYTYTAVQLQSKTFGQLKSIARELDIVPTADRRCRQTWIDALLGLNLPLLQLLEVSPGVEAKQVQKRKKISGVEPKQVQEPPIVKVANLLKLQSPETLNSIAWLFFNQSPEGLQEALSSRISDESEDAGFVQMIISSFCRNGVRGCTWDNIFERFQRVLAEEEQRQAQELASNERRRVRKLEIQRQKLIEAQAQGAIAPAAENSPGVEVVPVQEPIIEMVETFPGVEVDQVQERIEVQAQEPIAPVVKISPGSRSKTSTAHQLLDLFKSSAHILQPVENSPGVKTEETVSESAIAPAAKISLDAESDRNPISTGITFSNRFLAHYSPPQTEIIHFQSDPDGQLSLLDFEVESELEPPDPDDFETLEEFRKDLARWDWEHPSSFDHFSDLPSSVQNESPLEVSLDSFCLWAPCPYDWYEPALLEPSKVSKLSPGCKSSSTSDFFIPTFDPSGDRTNGSDESDEPPDTGGIFARLPKPKPPKFPPQTASQPQVNQVSRNYPETILKLFHRIVAGSITQPARSPPGGDAM